jgi:uncharacterized membrane protein
MLGGPGETPRDSLLTPSRTQLTDTVLLILTFCTALGCGLMAGAFFGFSAFIMKALARLPAPQGIAAMQSINVFAVTPLFMTALFGTGAACLLLAIAALFVWERSGAGYLFLGSLLYLVGTVVVTIVFNVPRNDALAAVHPESADGARLWTDYASGWTAWNHVRTTSALVAAALLTIAVCLQRAWGAT